jgi:hypothetical protein
MAEDNGTATLAKDTDEHEHVVVHLQEDGEKKKGLRLPFFGRAKAEKDEDEYELEVETPFGKLEFEFEPTSTKEKKDRKRREKAEKEAKKQAAKAAKKAEKQAKGDGGHTLLILAVLGIIAVAVIIAVWLFARPEVDESVPPEFRNPELEPVEAPPQDFAGKLRHRLRTAIRAGRQASYDAQVAERRKYEDIAKHT